jgi:thiamine-phosphate pyrophosphorylase
VVDARIVLVTDRHLAPGNDVVAQLARVLGLLPARSALVQLREKDLPGRALFELATEVRALTRRFGSRLLLNDRIDVALATEADGVHLPEAGLAVAQARALLGPRLIGVSTHSAKDAVAQARAGADLVFLGPVYTTPSKRAYGAPLGVEALRNAAAGIGAAAKTRLYAVGGIDSLERAREVRRAGAYGVAVVRVAMLPEGAELIRQLQTSSAD